MFDAIATWIEWKIQSSIVSFAEQAVTWIWWLQKLVGFFGDWMMTTTAWESVVSSMFGSVKATMPGALRNLMFGAGGGLFYLAIICVGLILIVPQMVRSGSRPAELDRVLMWSIFVVALFISSTAGYDLIVNVESARQNVPRNMASSFSAGSQSLSTLISVGMSATSAEIATQERTLPALFKSTYFPAPSGFETLDVVFYDAPLIGTNRSTLTVETAASLQYRRAQAATGLMLVAFNVIPTMMVLTIALALAALLASALIVLLLLVMGLPLGLFEFGQLILAQIFKRYLLLWMLSILVGAFPAILMSTTGLLLAPPITLSNMLTYVLLLSIAQIACGHLLKLVMKTAFANFSQIGNAMNAAAAPYAAGVALPVAAGRPSALTMGTLLTGGVAGGAFAGATAAVGSAAIPIASAAAVAYGAWQMPEALRGEGHEQPPQSLTLATLNHQDVSLEDHLEGQQSWASRPPHAFAYLDDPSVVEGDWEPIPPEEIAS